MPPDRLITLDPRRTADAVLAVLTGRSVDTVAADFGLDHNDIAEATDAYRAAGLAALQQQTDDEWYNVRVEFPDWDRAEAVVAEQLGPRLNELLSPGFHIGWWFLRKHPHWRLRLHRADHGAVASVLNDLVHSGVLSRWSASIYEPETAAFGGMNGMSIAHDLFCADSHGVLNYARQTRASLGRRELSLMLLAALNRAAGLDWFEQGDVLHRVAQIRPTPPETQQHRVVELAASVRTLLSARLHPGSAPLSPGVPADPFARWLAAFQTAGQQLATAASHGQLQRGLRAVLVHIVIFHWNRLGLSATTQGVIAHAASAALLPRS